MLFNLKLDFNMACGCERSLSIIITFMGHGRETNWTKKMNRIRMNGIKKSQHGEYSFSKSCQETLPKSQNVPLSFILIIHLASCLPEIVFRFHYSLLPLSLTFWLIRVARSAFARFFFRRKIIKFSSDGHLLFLFRHIFFLSSASVCVCEKHFVLCAFGFLEIVGRFVLELRCVTPPIESGSKVKSNRLCECFALSETVANEIRRVRRVVSEFYQNLCELWFKIIKKSPVYGYGQWLN